MSRGRVSRADLLTAIVLGRDDPVRAAALVGYEPLRDEPRPDGPEQLAQRKPGQKRDGGAPPRIEIQYTVRAEPTETRLRTWRVVLYDREKPPSERPERLASRPTLADRKETPPAIAPLAPARSLLVRLRRVWEQQQARGIDVDAAIERISRGEILLDLPRSEQRKWGRKLVVIADRSERLVPYWADQDYAVRALLPLFPSREISVRVVSELDQRAITSPGEWPDWTDCHLLVLGDLGALERRQQGVSKEWLAFGKEVRRAGGRPLALVPCARSYLSPDVREWWDVIPWEPDQATHSPGDDPQHPPALHLLQVLLSHAIRLEPGLVRQVRRMLPKGSHDAALESFFWQQDDLIGTMEVAATWSPAAAKRLRREFDRPFHLQADSLRERALLIQRSWRRHLPDEIFFEELVGLAESTTARLGWQDDYRRAIDYFRWLKQNPAMLTPSEPTAEWFCRLERRLSDSTWSSSPVSKILAQLWSWAHQDDPGAEPPIHLKTVNLAGSEAVPEQKAVICEGKDGLTIQLLAGGRPPQRVVAETATRNTLLQTETPFWKGPPPRFAKRFDRDEYGPWFEFEVSRPDAPPVRQRMRWIPAGSFLMGSPDSEAGRWDREGPQHEVTISRGFWMFDTPCTQELWSAVMGENPSRLQGERRPVERVSWHGGLGFANKLHEMLGLEFSLPTEAQWEYACRAGTTTAYHFGDSITAANARYDVGQDLGTADVGAYPSNAWGLYDMHGNVWEWCLDGQRTYSHERVTDPIGPTEESAVRVVRGGSWRFVAQFVRAACRSAFAPAFRDNDLGFRCVWVQSVAEPVEPVRSDRAGEGAEPGRTGGAVRVTIRPQAMPAGGKLAIVRTDCQRLTLECIEQPNWASAFGRDRYGLWAEVAIEPEAKRRTWFRKRESRTQMERVVQRLRWIPPGTFQMGSPDSEAGRYDNEGPQHEVTISRGFWMFDTPCTQQLWDAVMDEDPSHFQDPLRPVESVDWRQAREFGQRLSARIDQLAFEVPTEAQWEYACRAGTTSPIYTGELQVLGDANAPDLDPIAWYGGNSGVDYHLDVGDSLDYLQNKQYTFDKAGTRRVKRKRPNPWGLYDMLGNVWEWCLDGERPYSETEVTDPIGPTEEDADRVVRGGSWDFVARLVRAACRFAYVPAIRNFYLGFRCVCSLAE